jgi:DNA invertase Pin-like site-specific DNA recombinase
LINNPESRRRQYGLATRAQALGWENAIVIDDDLGRSGGGTARPGFERLLAAICTGAAGAVLALEASRLARNGRDWHTLLEFCTLVNCLIIDEDGVYDPKLVNDRLLLGMKGTFSELELSILRQRSQEALRLKAARGDLHTSVAIGYVRSADDRLELDPDKRVREAIDLAFHKFTEFASVRQVAIWLCDEGIKMPIVVYGPRGRMVEWQLPRYNTIHRLLTNPVYAGAYAFGRTGSEVRVEAGHKLITRSVRRLQPEWGVLIRDHHEGYISWDDYENNQRTINGNANMKGEMVPGSVRNGGGLLVGLLRCGHCGRKLKVQHNGQRGTARYLCNDTTTNHGRRTNCIAFGNMRIDAAVSAEVLSLIAPLGLDAALQAIADREHIGAERLRQIELALEQARYEAARAHRQYDAVDPDNRLVAGDLERRWNERLGEAVRLEEELGNARDRQPQAIIEAERVELLALGRDLPRLWKHSEASAATRKRILRAVLEEIVVRVELGHLRLKMHWKGGDHTTLDVVKNRVGQHRWKTDATTQQLICDLAPAIHRRFLAEQTLSAHS